jgi:hypothetical protein
MSGLRRNVDGALAPLQRIHEIWKAFPLPTKPRRQDRIRNFLYAFHQIHQRLTDATVAAVLTRP